MIWAHISAEYIDVILHTFQQYYRIILHAYTLYKILYELLLYVILHIILKCSSKRRGFSPIPRFGNKLFDAKKGEIYNRAEQKLIVWQNKLQSTLIKGLIGADDKEPIKQLKKYIKNVITSESENSNYVLYHGGNFDDINFDKALQKAICFSDGLGSGCLFDVYASAFALSGYSKKLYILKLDREQLLKGEYPIFIPTAHHLLSGAGNRELFHVRTKVVKAVLKENTLDESDTIEEGDTIDESTLSINGDIKPFVAGYKLTETPELFTTQNPQRFKDGYEYKSEGVFDETGAKKLIDMIKTITKVPETGIF